MESYHILKDFPHDCKLISIIKQIEELFVKLKRLIDRKWDNGQQMMFASGWDKSGWKSSAIPLNGTRSAGRVFACWPKKSWKTPLAWRLWGRESYSSSTKICSESTTTRNSATMPGHSSCSTRIAWRRETRIHCWISSKEASRTTEASERKMKALHPLKTVFPLSYFIQYSLSCLLTSIWEFLLSFFLSLLPSPFQLTALWQALSSINQMAGVDGFMMLEEEYYAEDRQRNHTDTLHLTKSKGSRN